jgi:hypothetical protein
MEKQKKKKQVVQPLTELWEPFVQAAYLLICVASGPSITCGFGSWPSQFLVRAGRVLVLLDTLGQAIRREIFLERTPTPNIGVCRGCVLFGVSIC